MIDDNKRMNVRVLGKDIGTAEGWDQMDTNVFMFYDFKASEEFNKIPNGDACFDFLEGTIQYHDDKGNVVNSHDMIAALT